MAIQQRLGQKVVRLEQKLAAAVKAPTLYNAAAISANLKQAQGALKEAKTNAPLVQQKKLEQQVTADIQQNTSDFRAQYQALLEAQQAQVAATTAAQVQQQTIYDRLLAEQKRQEELQAIKAAEAQARLAQEQRNMLEEQNRMSVLASSRQSRSTAYRSIYAT